VNFDFNALLASFSFAMSSYNFYLKYAFMNHIFNCFMFVNPGNGSFLKYIFVYFYSILKKLLFQNNLKTLITRTHAFFVLI
jgi:hypothetical protein